MEASNVTMTPATPFVAAWQKPTRNLVPRQSPWTDLFKWAENAPTTVGDDQAPALPYAVQQPVGMNDEDFRKLLLKRAKVAAGALRSYLKKKGVKAATQGQVWVEGEQVRGFIVLVKK
jgi:hypothetical protein